MPSALRLDALPVQATVAPSAAEALIPGLFSPRSTREAKAPGEWAREHRDELQSALLTSGVVLLRGFQIEDPAVFSDLCQHVGGPLGSGYEGPSIRSTVAKSVYSASEVPSALVIPEHAEMSYLPRMARQLFFWCRQPARSGGATTLVDARKVLTSLDPHLLEPFLRHKLRTRRRHAAARGLRDPFELKPWTEMFGTHDRNEAIASAERLGFRARFEAHGALTLEHDQDAVRIHPITGEAVWLNHLLVFHASAPTALLESGYRREHNLRSGAMLPIARAYRETCQRIGWQVASDVVLSNGDSIPDHVVARVRAAVDRHAYAHAWQRGDLVIVDNHLALHGRRPFQGPRHIALAWSEASA